jgi:hypothetical protein
MTGQKHVEEHNFLKMLLSLTLHHRLLINLFEEQRNVKQFPADVNNLKLFQ